MADPQPFAAAWLVDKPQGPSSHAIVAGARRRLGGVKVGHAGTLDPFATGLLVLLGGRATRLARFFSDLDKTYVADVFFGARSVTGDPEGPITPGAPRPEPADIAPLVADLAGVHDQEVPAYSAVKVEGERLYRRARRGEAVDLPRRAITISAPRVIGWPELGVARIEVTCSSGTYVRQIARELGERAGCGAYCQALRRTAIGPLSIADAISPEAIAPGNGLDLATGLPGLERRDLTDAEAADVVHGRRIGAATTGMTALVHGRRLIGIGEARDGELRPRIMLVAGLVAVAEGRT